MASLGQRKGGSYYVQFVECRERVTVSLGQLPDKKTADGIRRRIETILQARKHNMPLDRSTSAWVLGLSDTMADELAKAGLIAARNRSNLRDLLDRVVKEYENGNKETYRVYDGARKQLLKYAPFKDGLIDVRAIDNEKADAWLTWLKSREIAEASWTDYVVRARYFFKKAIRWNLTDENPFVGIRGGSYSNKTRGAFVDADLIHRMIAATDPSFGLVLAFSRFGGLRIWSEVRAEALDWSNFDWRPGSFVIHSSKTGTRVCPMFPELRRYVEPLKKKSGPVIKPISKNTMVTKLNRLIRKFNVKKWPRLFHNMRASRHTELVKAGWPEHIVCHWLGNSPKVAQEHYLQVLPSDYDEAAALQHALQQAATMTTNDRQPGRVVVKKSQKTA